MSGNGYCELILKALIRAFDGKVNEHTAEIRKWVCGEWGRNEARSTNRVCSYGGYHDASRLVESDAV
jgi:hypothetical protein